MQELHPTRAQMHTATGVFSLALAWSLLAQPALGAERAIVSPPSGSTLSNLYGSGTEVPITVNPGGITANHLEVGEGLNPTRWTKLDGHIWNTQGLPNGPYTIRLQAATTGLVTVLLANIDVTASARQLDLRRGETVAFTTTLGVPARQTILVKDLEGKVVRTIAQGERDAGEYLDSWDGLDDSGRRLRDGQYRWVATFSSDDSCLTIDRSAELDGDYEVRGHADYPRWNPFDNMPLRFSYSFERPGDVFLLFSRQTFIRGLGCNPPERFCRWLEATRPAGELTYEWAGVDDTGTYRDDIRGIFVVSSHENLARNAVVLHGGRPRVGSVRVSPATYSPGGSSQVVTFDLDSYRNEPVEATVTWTNQESLSTLRTLRLGKVGPGLIGASWDGRADNGMAVALGNYTVTVTACDGLGQCSRGQILTRLDY